LKPVGGVADRFAATTIAWKTSKEIVSGYFAGKAMGNGFCMDFLNKEARKAGRRKERNRGASSDGIGT
jgi:hypothetical protein